MLRVEKTSNELLRAEPLMPVWFRRGLIVVASLLMCSCSAMKPASGREIAYDCPACEEGCATCAPVRRSGNRDEYLCDGEDRHTPVGVTGDNDLLGLEQEDTVGIYSTRDGRRKVAPSTRVCIYAPRFGAVRKVVHPMGAEQRLFVDAIGETFSPAEAEKTLPPTTSLQNVALHERAGELPPSLYRGRQQAGAAVRLRAVAETRGLVGPYANLSLVHLGEILGSEEPAIANHALAAITWSGDQQVQVTISGQGASAIFSAMHPGVLFKTNEPNCPRLRIVKLASTDAAHPGDEIDFTLRMDNIGDAPMDEVTIVDNLTSRFAYVEGSAKASIDAKFSTTRNDAGSLILQWDLDNPLAAGEGGVLTFRVRVR